MKTERSFPCPQELATGRILGQINPSRIWSFHSVAFEEYHLMGYNAVQSVECQPMFRRNKSSPSSVPHLFFANFLLSLFFRPWWWRRYVFPKLRLTFNGLHGVISQKMVHFKLILSTPFNPICFRSDLLLFYHLCPGLPSGLFPSGFHGNISYGFVIFLAHFVTFIRCGVVVPPPNLQAGESPLVTCPGLLDQYILIYPSIWNQS
jgi:hypothetical protein